MSVTPTFIQNHTSTNNKVSNTTGLVLTTSATAPLARNTLIAYIFFDNTGTSTPTVSSIGKPADETSSWFRRGSHDSSTATSGGGCRGELWIIKTTVGWPASTDFTVTLDAAVTAKAAVWMEFKATFSSLWSAAVSGTSTTSVPSVTSATSHTDYVTVGCAAFETAGVMTGDADTSDGAWSTLNTTATTGGSTATNVTGGMQYKIAITDSISQTYNPTNATSTDSGAVIGNVTAANEYDAYWPPTTPDGVIKYNPRIIQNSALTRSGRW